MLGTTGQEPLAIIADRYPRLFMALVHHKTTKGEPLTFSDKEWLRQIYMDNSRELVIVKCSQVHMTEHALCAMFTFAHQGKRGMYILPSKEHRKTFVSDRINRLKERSPLYDKAIKAGLAEADSNVYKSIFGMGWKFVGSNVRSDFFEFPCEVLMMDEYDLLDEENLWYAYDRVENAPDAVIWKFGNPTRDGVGIHGEWLLSDQKDWNVVCEHCGHEQTLDWYEHFVVEEDGKWKLRHPAGRPICLQCGKDFDRCGAGQWIAANSGSTISGYRVSRLFVEKHKSPNDIIYMFRKFIRAQNNPTALENFHNNYLAAVYERSDFKITRDLLQKAVYDRIKDYDPNTYRAIMGVDQGKHYTCVVSVVIDGVIYDIHYANVRTQAEVAALEQTYNVICTVIDAQGGGYAETRDFVAADGRRWMCYYRPKDQIKTIFNINHEEQVLETNRTEILDLMAMSVKNHKTRIPADYIACVGGAYAKQMIVPARTTDAGGRAVWTKGVDHFFHASGYRFLAKLVSGMSNSVSLGTSWRKQRATVASNIEPKARILGGVVQPLVERPRKKGWRIK